MNSSYMIRVLVPFFSVLWMAVLGLGCGDSDSGGTQAACGYACVKSDSERGEVSAGIVSPDSASDCQAKKDNLQTKTDYAICADDLVTVSSSGSCDAEGIFFLFELDAAIFHCTLIGADNLPACIEDVFRNHPRWNFPADCIACAGVTYANFEGCIGTSSPLDEDSLQSCIDTWVSDSAACPTMP